MAGGREAQGLDALVDRAAEIAVATARRLLDRPPILFYGMDGAVAVARQARALLRADDADDDRERLLRFGLRLETAVIGTAAVVVSGVAQVALLVWCAFAADPWRLLALVCLVAAWLAPLRTWMLVAAAAVLLPSAGGIAWSVFAVAAIGHVAWARFQAELVLLLGGPRIGVARVLATGGAVACAVDPHGGG